MAQINGLNFHQTFRPEKHYIAAILELAGDQKFRTVKEISMFTGIPVGERSGKVEPHIFYANYMGLINFEKKKGKYSLTRSAIGEIVFMEDPGFQEILTELICHSMIVREESGAKVWFSVFRNVMPRYKLGIKKSLIIKELNILLENKVTSKNIAPFFGSYDSFFDNLSIVFDDGELIKILSNPYHREYIYVYAIALLIYWKEKYPDQDEITSDQLNALCFGNVFGWDAQEEYEVLEYLSDNGIIRLNRQLMPYTILKLVKCEELIDNLYSELC